MSDFKFFATKVFNKFTEMSKGELFTVDIDGDNMYSHYISSFPEGTNPIFKTRTEHECSTCKNFIRNLGLVVSISGGKLDSVWNVKGLQSPYKEVAAALHQYVISANVKTIFRSTERSYGVAESKQLIDTGVHRWNHLHGVVAAKHYAKANAATQIGEFNAHIQVFSRGLEEFTKESIDSVLDLITSKSIYRGEEHKPAVDGFKKLFDAYHKLKTAKEKNIFIMENANTFGARIRNTVIGTLIQDLSAGEDLEKAVRSFETKVAPTNYKRTTALITPRMIQDAMKTIGELGLESALERRLANISDVSVNNVLWVDNAVKPMMKGGIEGLLMEATSSKDAAISFKNPVNIGIEEFMTDILPSASEINMYVKNEHLANFATLTAPVHADSQKLFKWNNAFGWSYDGNITDTIRERVKAAGGNVDAKLRFSLSWFNYDDLDIYVTEPNGREIYFCNKDGKLDVDMNAGSGRSRTPVENVSFKNPQDGVYVVKVNQYSRRETTNVGFVIEAASGSGTNQYSYNKAVSGKINVGSFTVKNGVIVDVKMGAGISGTGISETKWGVKTESPVKVKTVMFSPNYWDDNKVGNKHWFFILEGCKTDQAARGIYNEFLDARLEKHRKVFEVLGDKIKCPAIDNQLSGLGFSSTRKDQVLVSVKLGKSTKVYNINF